MSTVLLTGGAGFIGLHLARAFEASGWDVAALDNLHPQVHLDAVASRARVIGTLCEGDVTDPAVWDGLPVIDAVVHLAAETGVGQSMYEVDRYRHVNVDGTRLAVAFAQERRVPFVFFSSRAVYGEGRFACPTHETVFGAPCCDEARPEASQETDPFRPVSVYGETKAEGELVVGEVADIPVTIIRPQNVIGPGQALHNPYTGVLAAFLARLREGKSLLVYGDGTQTRDFVHVSDLAALVRWLVDHRPATPGPLVVNCGSGVRTSLRELAAYSIEGAPLEQSVAIEHVDVHRAGDIDHACADLDRLRGLGAPLPEISARSAVADFITRGWTEPGAPSSTWDDALDELEKKGLTS